MLDHCRPLSTILDHSRPFPTILDHSRPLSTIPDRFRSKRPKASAPGPPVSSTASLSPPHSWTDLPAERSLSAADAEYLQTQPRPPTHPPPRARVCVDGAAAGPRGPIRIPPGGAARRALLPPNLGGGEPRDRVGHGPVLPGSHCPAGAPALSDSESFPAPFLGLRWLVGRADLRRRRVVSGRAAEAEAARER